MFLLFQQNIYHHVCHNSHKPMCCSTVKRSAHAPLSKMFRSIALILTDLTVIPSAQICFSLQYITQCFSAFCNLQTPGRHFPGRVLNLISKPKSTDNWFFLAAFNWPPAPRSSTWVPTGLPIAAWMLLLCHSKAVQGMITENPTPVWCWCRKLYISTKFKKTCESTAEKAARNLLKHHSSGIVVPEIVISYKLINIKECDN